MQQRPARERAGAFDRVLQLAHVARPVVLHDQAQSVVGEGVVDPRFALHLRQDVRGQQGNIALAFAQRRDAQRHDVQPEVEILPKAPRFHHAQQVAVGGCQHARRDGDRLRCANWSNLFFLQRSQQLGL
jgi:hypothetical protein